MKDSLKIGLALGSGAARGWAHIGVINALKNAGIKPDVVVGTSIGALVGAAYLSNKLPDLQQRLLKLTKLETARFFNIGFPFNGVVNKDKLHEFLTLYVADETVLIESLPERYASVATHLHSGQEVWNTEGKLLEAVWSSISLPGLFPAIKHHGRWLIDGGLVNPVPVSVCRALGADIVIAVNLNGDILGKHLHQNPPVTKNDQSASLLGNRISEFITNYTGNLFAEDKPPKEDVPDMFAAIAASVNITQDRITRSRMAGDPPDVLLQPRLSHIGLLEFYRAAEAIEAGAKSVDKNLAEIQFCLGQRD
ncbi:MULTISPECIES: patatin-like phospholipase family protein [unclassified Methylophaga]|jgi:NTE family protein|uniref:patatin-like phospholipase family protein n=2 Tax=Methylophaga TaxID=40222 RepID=UPI000C8A6424|nr:MULTISPECIES: patatin-like phospholipase family protein [unclassified Methylophaga]MAK65733.1 patatin [Methylophaga sp.]MAY16457.1 patatin [Methylophaga sp.]MBN45043.1 patatin [Methylophaga sp.]HAO24095.1 patatin [Methylophaga sp.]|tara:strand:+ start:81911 stop:82834 length:924 start_codon:yes stop_codon:yes gene_type:complete